MAVKIKKYNEKQTFCGVLPLEMQCQRAGAGESGAVCAKGNQTGLKTGAVNRDEPWEGNCLLSGMFFPWHVSALRPRKLWCELEEHPKDECSVSIGCSPEE